MKRLLSLILLISMLSQALPAEAHFGGVPVIKINNKATALYTTEEIASVGEYSIPSDVGAENYLVNKSVTFQADKDRLPFPEEVVDKATYEWDFGDGNKAKGEKVQHAYNKIGSYEIILRIDFPKEFETDPESVGSNAEMFGFTPVSDQQQFALVHIVPDKDYQVPKIVVKVDGKEINDPKERIELTFFNKIGPYYIPKSISFDASGSKGSAKIKEYLWSFEYDNTRKGAKTTYAVKDDYFVYDVGLRMIDENNFMSATFIKLYNPSKMVDGENQEKTILPRTTLFIAGAGILGMIAFGVYLIIGNGKKKSEKDE